MRPRIDLHERYKELGMDVHHPLAGVGLALIAQELGGGIDHNNPDISRLYQKMMRKRVEDLDYNNALAVASFYVVKGDHKNAVAYLKELIKYHDAGLEPYVALAQIYLAQEEYANALAYANLAIRKSDELNSIANETHDDSRPFLTNPVKAFLTKAIALEKNGDYSEAANAFQAAIAADHLYAESYIHYASMLIDCGYLKNARELINTIPDKHVEDPEIVTLFAHLYDRELKQDPKNPELAEKAAYYRQAMMAR